MSRGSATWTCGPPVARTSANGPCSSAQTIASRCGCAPTMRRSDCRHVQFSPAPRAAPGWKICPKKRRASARLVAAAAFLIFARSRLFLDHDALALADFLAPAAVCVGLLLALGDALAVLDFPVEILGRRDVVGRSLGIGCRGRGGGQRQRADTDNDLHHASHITHSL